MHLHVRGEHIPEAQLEVLAAITDHAGLSPAEVVSDETSGIVLLPIVRYPLLRRRRVFGNLHDGSTPIRATVTIRNVLACAVEDHTASGPDEQVHLLFGLRVRSDEIYLCSAEEDRGSTRYSVTIDISGVDIELSDEPDVPADE